MKEGYRHYSPFRCDFFSFTPVQGIRMKIIGNINFVTLHANPKIIRFFRTYEMYELDTWVPSVNLPNKTPENRTFISVP